MLIPMMGLKGAALATVITEVILALLLFIQLQKENNFPLPWKELLKIILAGSLMGIVLFIIQDPAQDFFGKYPSILIFLGVAGILFFGSLYIMKFFTPEIQRFIAKK